MSSPSDAEVIGRSLGEPEAFGLIYDRHAAALLRFLGRRAGAKVAEGLVGELFRIAFERRKTFDLSRGSALPWLYGIGSNLLLKHRRGEARRLRASARMATGPQAADRRASAAALEARVLFSRVADAIEALPAGEREALLLFRGRSSRTRTWPRRSSCRSARCARGSTAPAGACANCSSRRGNVG
jgi:DNA-directed RNA polymerase specialized sigma24 family protein